MRIRNVDTITRGHINHSENTPGRTGAWDSAHQAPPRRPLLRNGQREHHLCCTNEAAKVVGWRPTRLDKEHLVRGKSPAARWIERLEAQAMKSDDYFSSELALSALFRASTASVAWADVFRCAGITWNPSRDDRACRKGYMLVKRMPIVVSVAVWQCSTGDRLESHTRASFVGTCYRQKDTRTCQIFTAQTLRKK